VYQLTTQVLSDAGSTGRPQMGHDIVAVADNASNMQKCSATSVPFGIAAKMGRHCATSRGNGRNPSRDAKYSAPRANLPGHELC
jgi:hypothetical protein